jgi:uncharacterized protein (TIGR02246 family)
MGLISPDSRQTPYPAWRKSLGPVTGFATPDLGQQTDGIDPQIDQLIRALTMACEEALNEHDAPAVAAFFSEDAVWKTPQGTFYGRRTIERRLADYHFHRWHIKNEVIHIDRMIAVGDEIQETGTWSNTIQVPDGSTQDFQGHFTSIFVLEDGNWKISVNTYDQSRSF